MRLAFPHLYLDLLLDDSDALCAVGVAAKRCECGLGLDKGWVVVDCLKHDHDGELLRPLVIVHLSPVVHERNVEGCVEDFKCLV